MISAKDITKAYKFPKKEKGLHGFIKSILKREYTKTIGVNKISFEVADGELVGLIGPNGAGKTTTMKMLSGILYPTSGKIDILGYTPFEKNPEFLKKIAFVMGQRNQLLWDLPATDSFQLNKEIYEVEESKYKKNVTTLSKLLDCVDKINQPVKTLSLGERMKMELIASLVYEPEILFLDEPTIGLDVVAQKVIRDFLKDYQKLTGATIILTSHYMEDVRALAKRIMIIDHGVIIYDGSFDKLVKKYATRKTIEVIVEEMPDPKILEDIDKEAVFNFPKVIFKIRRSDVPEKISEITKKIKFVDLNIYEERVEDIVRKIFTASRH